MDVGAIEGAIQRKEELPHLHGLISTTQVVDDEHGECYGAITLGGRPSLANVMVDASLMMKEYEFLKSFRDLNFSVVIRALNQMVVGMKKAIVDFVASCVVCLKSKVEHQTPSGMLQPLDILVWKWDNIAMDFVS
ncbi:hypothetical protein RJT34_20209 [Clitoria ternatea]|uniref:Uncharacterized protein n=1 Tax=Clitoria ternatea TaxID=43366 RepID=A0AAN9ISS9_CLITE